MKKILIVFSFLLCCSLIMAETVTINTNSVIIGNKKVDKNGTLELGKSVKLDKVVIGDVKNGEKRFFIVKENDKEILKTKFAIKEDATISVTLKPGAKYQFEWKGAFNFSTVQGKKEDVKADEAEEKEEAKEDKAEKKDEKAVKEDADKKEEVKAKENKPEEETSLVEILDDEEAAAAAEADAEAEKENGGGTSAGIIVWLVILTILLLILIGLVWLFTKTINAAMKDDRLAETIVRVKALEQKINEMPTRSTTATVQQEPAAAPQPTRKIEWTDNTPGKELRDHNEEHISDLFSQIDDLQKTFTISPDDDPAEE